jgi:hypothetical protein
LKQFKTNDIKTCSQFRTKASAEGTLKEGVDFFLFFSFLDRFEG